MYDLNSRTKLNDDVTLDSWASSWKSCALLIKLGLNIWWVTWGGDLFVRFSVSVQLGLVWVTVKHEGSPTPDWAEHLWSPYRACSWTPPASGSGSRWTASPLRRRGQPAAGTWAASWSVEAPSNEQVGHNADAATERDVGRSDAVTWHSAAKQPTLAS